MPYSPSGPLLACDRSVQQEPCMLAGQHSVRFFPPNCSKEKRKILPENTRIVSLSEQQKPAIFYLKPHLVEKWLPEQTKAALRRVELIYVGEVNYTVLPALRWDFSTDGQRALIGREWNAFTAWPDVDIEST